MHIECTQENLARALSRIGRLVGTRGTLPVLGNILLSVEKGRLRLAATDLEVAVQTWIGGKVQQDGALTVPARLFIDFVTTNSDTTMVLSSTETTLHLKSDHFSANIKGIDASEFPLMPKIKHDNPLLVPQAAFKEAIGQVVFATAIDETRPVLTGVLLKVTDDTLVLAATDSYRLAEKTLPLEKKYSSLQVIIPARTLQEASRMLGFSDEPVQLAVADNQLLLAFGDTELISRLIDGTFPDYGQIVPKEMTTELVVPKNQLAQVMKMASFFARESANNVQLTVTGKGLEVTAISPQLGDTVSNIPSAVTGESIEIAFNAKFILDGLTVISEGDCTLSFSGKLQPGILRPVGNMNYFYLLMPLRVDS